MNQQQIALAQDSWRRGGTDRRHGGRALFYGRHFEIAPEVRPLFRGDLKEQGRKLMLMLKVVVGGLSRLDTLVLLSGGAGTCAPGCDWMPRVRISFDASAVAFERDDTRDVQSLVLAEHRDGRGRWLEVQRPLQVDDQDLALGLDTSCLVTEEQATQYGGVVDWRIEGSVLHLDLTEKASRAIGASGFRITLPESERATVQRALLVLLV